MHIPYVVLVLHAISTRYISTVFLFRRTYRHKFGLFEQTITYTFILKLYRYKSNKFQWK